MNLGLFTEDVSTSKMAGSPLLGEALCSFRACKRLTNELLHVLQSLYLVNVNDDHGNDMVYVLFEISEWKDAFHKAQPAIEALEAFTVLENARHHHHAEENQPEIRNLDKTLGGLLAAQQGGASSVLVNFWVSETASMHDILSSEERMAFLVLCAKLDQLKMPVSQTLRQLTPFESDWTQDDRAAKDIANECIPEITGLNDLKKYVRKTKSMVLKQGKWLPFVCPTLIRRRFRC